MWHAQARVPAWIFFLALVVTDTVAEAAPMPLNNTSQDIPYTQRSLAQARSACRGVMFADPKIAAVFGPPNFQNGGIETTVLRVTSDHKGNVVGIEILITSWNVFPPTLTSFVVVNPCGPDFPVLVARVLLSK
jgi:hypothetical protein